MKANTAAGPGNRICRTFVFLGAGREGCSHLPGARGSWGHCEPFTQSPPRHLLPFCFLCLVHSTCTLQQGSAQTGPAWSNWELRGHGTGARKVVQGQCVKPACRCSLTHPRGPTVQPGGSCPRGWQRSLHTTGCTAELGTGRSKDGQRGDKVCREAEPKAHQKHRGSAQTAEGLSAFLQKTQAAPVCLQIPRSSSSSTRPGCRSCISAAKQAGAEGTQGCPLHTLKTSQLQRLLQHVSPSPWNTSTHTQPATPHILGSDTLTGRAVGNVTRQKQRSPCAPLRNSASINAWCKVQAWLMPGGA